MRDIKLPVYIIITPAYNEETNIEKTIESMINQTVLPQKWVIVNDGSTDNTAEIVKSYAKKYEWIDILCRKPHADRNFAAKVKCFNTGYKEIEKNEYDIIGNLDADISFGPDYFEYILNKFQEFPELGVAGTPFVEDSSQVYNYEYTNIEHVSGACQVFRKECFIDIGGYLPVKAGGIDWIAVTTARMVGWMTRTFTDRVCYHHRKIGTAHYSNLRSYYKYGEKDYYLGWHPLWEIFRSIYQMSKKPYIIGGTYLLSGYINAWIRGVKRPVSKELIDFHRSEQLNRLYRIPGSMLHKIFK